MMYGLVTSVSLIVRSRGTMYSVQMMEFVVG